MNSSVGSDLFAFSSILLISISVLFLLRHFLPLRTTPAYLLIPIFLALALPVSIILLVPIDLASSLRTKDESSRGIWLPDGVVLVAWRVAYWLTFALTWFILPLLGEYIDSGFRTPRSRMIYSVRSNGRYQLVVLACGIAGLFYVFYQNGFEGSSVKALVMALAYCWGLILAIYLMGHGLVAIPRRLYRNANVSGRLRRIQARAPKINEHLENAMAELEELEAQVTLLKQRKHAISRDHQAWVEEISEASNLPESRLFPNSATKIPVVITDRYLADLSRRLNRARHKRIRFTDVWDRLVQDAADMQAILDASASKKLNFGKPSPQASIFQRATILTPYTRYLVYAHVVPAIRMIFATLSSLASLCIVWSELIKFVAPKFSIIRLTVVSHRKTGESEVGFVGQISASIWILYMCTAALASFDDVKIWGNRALVRRNTYGESATWYSGQIAKLTVPLAYNFVTFLPPDVHQKTTFYHFLGRLVNLTPLGKGFDYFFPILILIPVCATLLNLYGRIKSIFGFGMFEEGEENSYALGAVGGWREGRDLIEQDLTSTSRLGLSTGGRRTASQTPAQPATPFISASQPSRVPVLPGNSSTAAISNAQFSGQSEIEHQQTRRLVAATEAAEEQDENVFQGFAHRVRNTLENVERPEWLSDLGRRPKWLGGVEGNQESSGPTDPGRGLGRWFGGRPTDGRVRL